VRAILGTGKGTNGVESVRGAKTNQNRVLWRRCWAAEEPAPVERRRRSAGVRGPAARVGYGLPDLVQLEE
jgi:hypothetical protein